MFYGFAIGALLINMNTGFAYMLDAYRSISMETFVAAVTFKNFMVSFVLKIDLGEANWGF